MTFMAFEVSSSLLCFWFMFVFISLLILVRKAKIRISLDSDIPTVQETPFPLSRRPRWGKKRCFPVADERGEAGNTVSDVPTLPTAPETRFLACRWPGRRRKRCFRPLRNIFFNGNGEK